MGTTNMVLTYSVKEWGQVVSCMRRSFPVGSRGNIQEAPGTAFESSRQDDAWKGGTRGHKMGSGIPRGRLTPGSSPCTAFRPSDFQMGPKVCMGVHAVFLASYIVVVGP
jgi:hypothetical protein